MIERYAYMQISNGRCIAIQAADRSRAVDYFAQEATIAGSDLIRVPVAVAANALFGSWPPDPVED